MKQLPDEAEVAIVGAGPTGLALAIGLARRGVNIVIVDALAEAQNTSRAAVIHSGTLDALDQIHVTEPLIDRGVRARHFRVRDRDRVLLRGDFSVLKSSRPYALMIPQDETEAILGERLAGLGHQVHRRARVTHVDRQHTGVVLTIDGEQGVRQVGAKYVVGADGENSTVRSQSGIPFPGSSYGSFMLADVRMQWPISRDEVTLFFSAEGSMVVAPMSQDRYRVVAQRQDAPREPTLRDAQSLIAARGPATGVRVDEILWGSRFQVHHKLADRFRDGRTLLIGDAAHVHSPAGGQGMNLGLRDAVALAEALPRALETGSNQPLDVFAGTRRAAAEEILRMTDRLTMAATVRSPILRAVRNGLIHQADRLAFVRRRLTETLAGAR